MDFEDLFDGEEHELFPGRDFRIMGRRFDRPLTESEERAVVVAGGWAVTAVRLNAIAVAMGGSPFCAWQKGNRYFFRFKKEAH